MPSYKLCVIEKQTIADLNLVCKMRSTINYLRRTIFVDQFNQSVNHFSRYSENETEMLSQTPRVFKILWSNSKYIQENFTFHTLGDDFTV